MLFSLCILHLVFGLDLVHRSLWLADLEMLLRLLVTETVGAVTQSMEKAYFNIDPSGKVRFGLHQLSLWLSLGNLSSQVYGSAVQNWETGVSIAEGWVGGGIIDNCLWWHAFVSAEPDSLCPAPFASATSPSVNFIAHTHTPVYCWSTLVKVTFAQQLSRFLWLSWLWNSESSSKVSFLPSTVTSAGHVMPMPSYSLGRPKAWVITPRAKCGQRTAMWQESREGQPVA